MLKVRVALLLAAALAVAVPTIAVAASQDQQTPAAPAAALAPVCGNIYATNAAVQNVVRYTSDPATYTSTSYVNAACGNTTISVPRGRRALVIVDVDAEVECTGPAGQWCLGRVLIGGVEAAPTAPEPSSLAWAHSDPSSTAWEANGFKRMRHVSCPATYPLARCNYAVVTQVRNHAAGLSFWVDDLTVHASLTYW